ncbi:MAG: DUF4091 domain-containing protein [Kiritimatiellia bacterium]|nr:DUF4091 domain-containing protein [Kiritimatiellia bacterium]
MNASGSSMIKSFLQVRPRWATTVTVGLFWFFAGTAFRLSAAENNVNLLRNPDFAEWGKGDALPKHWGTWAAPVKAGEISAEPGAVRFTDASQAHQLTQSVPVTGGVDYALSCLKKVQLGSHFLTLAVQWRDKDGKGVGYSMDLDGGYDADFQSGQKVFTAPSNACRATVIIGPYCVNRKGAVATGSIRIKHVSFGPAPAGSGKPAAAARPLDAGERAAANTLLALGRHPAFADIRKRLDDPAADPVALRRELNLAEQYPGGKRLFAVGAATESDKLYPDTPYTASLNGPLRLALAGGEYGSFQLAVIPFWTNLTEVTVSFSPLRKTKRFWKSLMGADVKEIAAGNFRWFRVGYVKLEKPNPWLGLQYKHPREPDPLLPAAPFRVTAGTVAPVWVDLLVPAGTPEGVYRGTVTVRANGQSVDRPIEVECYGFDIPKTSSVANEFWLSPGNWRGFYGKLDYTPALHARHAATLGRYRVSSFPCDWTVLCSQVPITAEPDGRFTFDWTTFDQYVRNALDNGSTAFWSALSCNSGWTRYLHNPRVKVFERATGRTVELQRFLPPGMTATNGWLPLEKLPYRENKVYRDFLLAYVRHLKELGINGLSHYELFDEPGGDRFREMLRHHRFFRELVPELKLLNFGTDPTQTVDGQTAAGLLDAWAPHLEVLDRPEALAAMLARRANHGEKLWAYSCIEYRRSPDGQVSHTSRHTEDHYSPFCLYHRPYLATRIQAWMAWKYKLDGFYIFMMNSLPPKNAGKTPAERWPNTEWSEGGERGSGTLAYPGPEFELIPGMRLANIREGLEDYEFFAALQSEATRLDKTRDAKLLQRIGAALEMDVDIVASVFDWTKDRERLEAKRRQLAGLIREARDARAR